MADSDSDARRTKIDHVVDDFVRRISAGESIDRDSVQQRYPELMPELGAELTQRQLIVLARKNFERARRTEDTGESVEPSEQLDGVANPSSDRESETTFDTLAESQRSFGEEDSSPQSESADSSPDSKRFSDDSNATSQSARDTVQLAVRCPHCSYAVKIMADLPWSEITCIGCGREFSLVSDGASTRAAPALKQIGHFELIERIGVGGFGTVWKARDTILDRVVALKIPRRGQLTEQEVDQFLREARAAAQLRHPGIVSVHEVGRTDEAVYIVSDLVRGVLLSEWAEIRSPSPHESASMVWEICSALHHAHEAGVVHRDLKPGNIMVDQRSRPHIMDFGLAKRDAGELTVTVEGQVLGTPAYMAPEQARGEAHDCTARTDIYSMGVVLYELLTGSLPFRGNASMLVHQVLTEEPPRPRSLNHHIPVDLETICLKCLEKDPAKRFADGGALAEELERFMNGVPIRSRPVGSAVRAWRWCRRNSTLSLMSLLTVLSLIVAAIVSTYFWMVVLGYQGDLRESRRDAEFSRQAARDSRDEAEKARGGTMRLLARSAQMMSSPFNRQLQAANARMQINRERDEQRKVSGQLAAELLADSARCPSSMHDYTWRLLYAMAMNQSAGRPLIPTSPWETQVGRARQIEFSDDSSQVAVAGVNSIRVFYTDSGHELEPINVDQPVNDLDWSFSTTRTGPSRFLAYCEQDGTARMVPFQGSRQPRIIARKHVVTCVAFLREDAVLLGTQAGDLVRVSPDDAARAEVDGNYGAPIADIDVGSIGVVAVAAGREIVLSRQDGASIRLQHDGVVTSVRVARNGAAVVSRTESGHVVHWRVNWTEGSQNKNELWSSGETLAIDVSPDSETVATIHSDRVRFWDAKSSEFRAAIDSQGAAVQLARFATHPTDEPYSLAVVDDTGKLHFWNGYPPSREQLWLVGNAVRCLTNAGWNQGFIAAGDAGSIDHFEGKVVRHTAFLDQEIRQLGTLQGAQRIVLARCQDGRVVVCEVAPRGELIAERFFPYPAERFGILPTGRAFLTLQNGQLNWASADQPLDPREVAVVRDESSRGEVADIAKGTIADLRLLRDATLALLVESREPEKPMQLQFGAIVETSGAENGTDELVTVAITNGIELQGVSRADIVGFEALSDNRTLILLDDGSLFIIAKTAEELPSPVTSAPGTHLICVSAKSDLIATANQSELNIWRLDGDNVRREMQPIREHMTQITALLFTANGRSVISASADNVLRSHSVKSQ